MDVYEDFETKRDFQALKRKFHNHCAELYPGVRYPEMVWLFEQALDLNPNDVVQTPFRKDSYLSFVRDAEGKRELHPTTNRAVKRRVRFTDEQKKIVKEWWPLLPQSMLDEG